MANQFIARKGLISLSDAQITGSLQTTGTLTVTGATTLSSTLVVQGMATVTVADISTGENVGLKLNNVGGGGVIWNVTPGVTGVNNSTFAIRDSTNNVNALTIAASTAAATFAGPLAVTGTTTTSRQVFINGTADETQLLVQAHSTQNNELVVFENSAGTNLLEFTNAGHMEMKVGSITMANQQVIKMRDSGATARDILVLSSSNVITIGNGSLATTISAALAVTGTSTLTGNAFFGTAVDTSGIALKKDGGGASIGLDLHNAGTNAADDVQINFETDGQIEWACGIDRTTGDWVLGRNGTLGSNVGFTLSNASTPATAIAGALAVTGTSAFTGAVGIGVAAANEALNVLEAGANTAIAEFTHTHTSTPHGLDVAFSADAPNDRTQWFFRGSDNALNKSYLWSDGGASFTGNVDVTTAPGAGTFNLLHLNTTSTSDTAPCILIEANRNSVEQQARIRIAPSTGQGVDLIFDTDDTSGDLQRALALTDAQKAHFYGDVGIGLTSPVEKLHVHGQMIVDDQTTACVNAIPVSLMIAGQADPTIGFGIRPGGSGCSMILGLDDSDGDKFKITAHATDVGGAAHFVMDSSGNVGIGTASPNAPLHMAGSGGAFMKLETTSGHNMGAQFSRIDGVGGSAIANTWHIYRAGGGELEFRKNSSGGDSVGTRVMMLNTSGGLGFGDDATKFTVSSAGAVVIKSTLAVGRTSASHPLDVDVGAPGSADKTIARFSSEAGTRSIALGWDDGLSQMGIFTQTNNSMFFGINGINQKMVLDSSGNLTILGNLTTGGSLQGVSITNASNNRVMTHTGSALNAEANLVFDGSKLGIGTTSLTHALTIIENSDYQFYVGRTTSKGVKIRDDVLEFLGMTSNGMRIQTDSNAKLVFSSGTGDTTFACGKFGIGLTDPDALLHVQGVVFGGEVKAMTLENHDESQSTDETVALHFQHQDMGAAKLVAGKDGSYGGSTVRTGNLQFHTHNSSNAYAEAMRITSAQFVGIGTVSPASRLHLKSPTGNVHAFRITSSDDHLLMTFEQKATDGAGRFDIYNAAGTSTVKLDTDGSSYFNGGPVGIGTTTPSSYDGEGDDFVIYHASTPGITIASGTSGRGSILWADGTSGGERYRGGITYDHTTGVSGAAVADSMYFRTAGSINMTLTGEGKLGIGTQNPNGRLTVANADSGSDLYGIAVNQDDPGQWAALLDGVAYGLDVVGPTWGLRVQSGKSTFAGSVGIGNTSPSYTLDVTGTLRATGTSTLAAINASGGITVANTAPMMIVQDTSTHSAGANTGAIYMQGLGSSGVNENLVSFIAQATASRYSNLVVQLSNGSGGAATALTLTGGATQAATFAGNVKALSWLVGGLTTALGIAGSFPDSNDSELGPGYLAMTRDDTAAAKQLQFWKNGSLHSGLMTDTNGLNFVGSDGAADVTIKTNGYVGIGTITPRGLLDVTESSSGEKNYYIGNEGSGIGQLNIRGGSTHYHTIGRSSTDGYLMVDGHFKVLTYDSSWHTGLYQKSDGKVGINTTNPTATLEVADGTLLLSKPDAGTYNYRFLPNATTTGDMCLQVSTASQGTSFADLVQFKSDKSVKFAANVLVGRGTLATPYTTNADHFMVSGVSTGGIILTAPTSSGWAPVIYLSIGRAPSGITNEDLGMINFTDNAQAVGARINANAQGQWASNDYPAKLVFSTTPAGSATCTPRVTIDKDGKLGINTTAPGSDLHIQKSTSATLHLESTVDDQGILILDGDRNGADSNMGQIRFQWNGTRVAQIAGHSGVDTGNKDDGELVFFTSAGSGTEERVRIDLNGKVGIGTGPAPHIDSLLHIKGGTVRAADASSTLTLEGSYGSTSNAGVNILSTGAGSIMFGDAGNSGIGKITYTHSSDSMSFTTGDGTRMTIASDGNTTVAGQTITLGSGYKSELILHTADGGTMRAGLWMRGGSESSGVYQANLFVRTFRHNDYKFSDNSMSDYDSGIWTETTTSSYGNLWFGTRDTKAIKIDTSQNTEFYGDIDVFGDITSTGVLEKDSGSFLINHPLPSMANTHNLRHSFIEGPRADLIYRGVVDLSSGTATVNIDTAAGMTEGTFEVLCRTDEAQVWLQNDTGWDAVRGSVSGNILTITCQNTNSTETISWMVIADRIDSNIMASRMYGEDGRMIVEPARWKLQ